MSSAVETMLNRTSIRRFRKKPVDEDALRTVLLVGQRTASPGGFQAYSLVIVDDAQKRLRIGEITRQRFIAAAPVFILLCVDMRRFRMMLDRLGHDYHFRHGQGLYAKLFSIVEAGMVAEQMSTAALFMGLGSCFVGAVFYEMEAVSKLLNLPEGVVPLLGLCLGYPAESPPLRPRWPLGNIVHKNKYDESTTEDIDRYLAMADEAMKQEGYYRKYSGKETTYTEHVKWKTQASKWIEEHDKSARDFLIRNGLALT